MAQAIALTSYGNMFLAGQQSTTPDLMKTNSTFQSVDNVKFFYGSSLKDAAEVSHDVPGWFAYLRSLEAKRLWLLASNSNIRIPDLISTSFGGRWAIQVDRPNRYDSWTANWHSPLKPLRPSRPWDVLYWGGRLEKPLGGSPNLGSALTMLLSGIAKARNLVSKVLLTVGGEANDGPRLPLNFYLGVFTEALQLAMSSNPKIPYPDMLPLMGYDLKARQVAASAGRAWVFGGMSSWNDLDWVFKGFEKEYREITENLYVVVVNALAAATNSFGAQDLDLS